MPRKSHADKILEGLEDIEDAEGPYLVLYDFNQPSGTHITHRFYDNLKRITQRLGDGRRIQLSVIECKMLRTAKAIKALCKRFNVRSVFIYRAEKIEAWFSEAGEA